MGSNSSHHGNEGWDKAKVSKVTEALASRAKFNGGTKKFSNQN